MLLLICLRLLEAIFLTESFGNMVQRWFRWSQLIISTNCGFIYWCIYYQFRLKESILVTIWIYIKDHMWCMLAKYILANMRPPPPSGIWNEDCYRLRDFAFIVWFHIYLRLSVSTKEILCNMCHYPLATSKSNWSVRYLIILPWQRLAWISTWRKLRALVIPLNVSLDQSSTTRRYKCQRNGIIYI